MHRLLMVSLLVASSLGAAVWEPAVAVNGRAFTVNELLGCSLSDLRAKFEADTKDWSAEQLRRFIAFDRSPTSRDDNLAERRQEAWEVAYSEVWNSAFGALQGAAVADSIASALGISLADYYDMGTLAEAQRRYSLFCMSLDEARATGRANSPDLRGELVQKCRCSIGEADWTSYAKSVLSRPQPRSLRRQFLGATGLAEARAKRMLVGPMLEDALAKGPYRRLALARLTATAGRYDVLEVADWNGSADALDVAVKRAMAPDGAWLASERGRLMAQLRSVGRAGVRLRDVFGVELDGLGFDPLSPRRMVAAPHLLRWAARPPGFRRPGTEPDPVAIRVAAMEIATDRWGATVLVRLPNWRPEWLPGYEDGRRGGITGCSAKECVPEVELGPFEKKQVPADLFEQWERGLPAYQDWVAQLVAAAIGSSPKDEAALRQSIAAAAASVPAVWRSHYGVLSMTKP